jgi:opacity protein-like surface antigen
MLLCMLLCLVTAAGAQQTPSAEISLGYSYVHSNIIPPVGCCFGMHGGSGSVAYNLNDWFGLVADVGGYHASNVKNSNLDLTVFTFMFGPRFSYRKNEKLVPFAQILVGGGHAGGSLYDPPANTAGGHYAFAATAGGGLDIKVHPNVAIRLFQAEYLFSRFKNGVNDRQNNLRVTTGLVFRFGSR